MSAKEREELRWRMLEAVLLEADHDRRAQVAHHARRAGPEAETEWLQLVTDVERLRMELQRVEIPPGLEDRLLASPRPSPRLPQRGRRAAAVTAAAAVIIVAAVALPWWRGRMAETAATHRLVAMAVRDHLNRPELSIRSGDEVELAETFTSLTALDVRFPFRREGLELLGGRICSFDGYPIVHTRWRRNGLEQSLYQARLADCDLKPAQKQRMFPPDERATYPDCRVVFWTDDECAFVLVIPAGELEQSSDPPGNA